MTKQPFQTTSRKVEQFFFLHDIHFERWYRNRDGLTTWVYMLDEEGLRVLEEWRRIVARRNQRREQEK